MITPQQAQLPLLIFMVVKTYYAYSFTINSSIYQYSYFKCMVRPYHMRHHHPASWFDLSTCRKDTETTRP
jgi:hypothetical protein